MLQEFQFSKLCVRHIYPQLNVNTAETWLPPSAEDVAPQTCTATSRGEHPLEAGVSVPSPLPPPFLHWGLSAGLGDRCCY